MAKNDWGTIGWLSLFAGVVVVINGSGTLLKSATKSVEKLLKLTDSTLFVFEADVDVVEDNVVVDVPECGTLGMLVWLDDCDFWFEFWFAMDGSK